MPDTVRTLAALQTLLADNVAGDISAQDVRDMLVSVNTPEWMSYLAQRLPDETAHADDDFFETDSSADYTEQTVTGTGLWSIGRGVLSCVAKNQTVNDMSAFVKPITVASPPMTIETRMRYFVPTLDFPFAGLMFTNGVLTTSSYAGVIAGGSNSSFQAGSLILERGTLTTTAAGQTFINQGSLGLAGSFITIYLRAIWKSANTWQGSISWDGNAWFNNSIADAAFTMTPTHVGFTASTNQETSEFASSVDYLRVYDADLSV